MHKPGRWTIQTSQILAFIPILLFGILSIIASGGGSSSSSGDATAPNAPVIISPDDGSAFNTNSLTVNGTAEANSTVELFTTSSLGTTSANASGDWSLITPNLSDGVHNLTATATDAAGNTSSASTVVSITVDTTAPTINTPFPADGATSILTNSVVSATFSEAMDDTTITASTFTLSGTSTLTGSISYNPSTLTATFTPTNSLKPGTSHTATLTTAVTDTVGNELSTVNSWSFTTEAFIRRVSVDSSGVESNGDNNGVTISADGRFVAFYTEGDNLVANDTNTYSDTFLHDTQTGTTTRVSVPNLADQGTLGTQANDHSDSTPAISADGRYVTFYSDATNLVSNDTNGDSDIFLHDTLTKTTTLISVNSSGVQGNGYSSEPVTISADGRYVTFVSTATNLVTDDLNAKQDIFLRDTQNHTTVRVSVPNLADQGTLGTEGDGASWPTSMSADGRFVAFASNATNLVTGDTNALQDIFVHDTQTGSTTRVSVPNLADQGTLGTQATGGISTLSSNPSISADGRYIAFESNAANLVVGDTNNRYDVFVHDTQTGATTRVSVPNLTDQGVLGSEGDSSSFTMSLAISSNGRYVAFDSDASNLVTGDTNGVGDIFVHDRQTGVTIRVNVDNTGTETDGNSHSAFISADGRYVAFISDATNLVPGDLNTVGDIFRVLNTTPP